MIVAGKEDRTLSLDGCFGFLIADGSSWQYFGARSHACFLVESNLFFLLCPSSNNFCSLRVVDVRIGPAFFVDSIKGRLRGLFILILIYRFYC